MLQISLDVPGVKSSDLSVTTDNKSIHITGCRRRAGSGGETIKKSRFAKSFKVDAQTVDLSKLTANLADGVLVVSAPKKPKPMSRSIMITTKPHHSEEDKKEADQSSTLGVEKPKDDVEATSDGVSVKDKEETKSN